MNTGIIIGLIIGSLCMLSLYAAAVPWFTDCSKIFKAGYIIGIVAGVVLGTVVCIIIYNYVNKLE